MKIGWTNRHFLTGYTRGNCGVWMTVDRFADKEMLAKKIWKKFRSSLLYFDVTFLVLYNLCNIWLLWNVLCRARVRTFTVGISLKKINEMFWKFEKKQQQKKTEKKHGLYIGLSI